MYLVVPSIEPFIILLTLEGRHVASTTLKTVAISKSMSTISINVGSFVPR